MLRWIHSAVNMWSELWSASCEAKSLEQKDTTGPQRLLSHQYTPFISFVATKFGTLFMIHPLCRAHACPEVQVCARWRRKKWKGSIPLVVHVVPFRSPAPFSVTCLQNPHIRCSRYFTSRTHIHPSVLLMTDRRKENWFRDKNLCICDERPRSAPLLWHPKVINHFF